MGDWVFEKYWLHQKTVEIQIPCQDCGVLFSIYVPEKNGRLEGRSSLTRKYCLTHSSEKARAKRDVKKKKEAKE